MRPRMVETMLELAHVWSKRGTCAKKQVGCVITDRNNNVLSSGYNGQPRGAAHCTRDTPCPAFTDPALSCNAIHAEMNALMRCPDIDKADAIYITEAPCTKCMLMLRNTSIRLVYYPDNRGEFYFEAIARNL